MTPSERNQILVAITHFSAVNGNGYEEGMRTLFHLLGEEYPLDKVLKELKPVTLTELLRKDPVVK